MTDIVERLRASYRDTYSSGEACMALEAAAEIIRLRAALGKLLKSTKPCPCCPPENECYIFSMVAYAEAGAALEDARK